MWHHLHPRTQTHNTVVHCCTFTTAAEPGRHEIRFKAPTVPEPSDWRFWVVTQNSGRTPWWSWRDIQTREEEERLRAPWWSKRLHSSSTKSLFFNGANRNRRGGEKSVWQLDTRRATSPEREGRSQPSAGSWLAVTLREKDLHIHFTNVDTHRRRRRRQRRESRCISVTLTQLYHRAIQQPHKSQTRIYTHWLHTDM